MQAQRGNVVVVEDDRSLNQAIGRLLDAAGFRPRLFESAEALLRDIDAEDPHCFVLDIHLSGMSGFALQRHLANRGSRVPIVFITAHDDPTHRKLALELGVGYLPKPFSSASLIEAVENAMTSP